MYNKFNQGKDLNEGLTISCFITELLDQENSLLNNVYILEVMNSFFKHVHYYQVKFESGKHNQGLEDLDDIALISDSCKKNARKNIKACHAPEEDGTANQL